MEQDKENTECCICMDSYTDPRILSCNHTFCLKCLEETAANRESESADMMPCPLCMEIFVIPKEGMVGIRKNIFMEKLLEVFQFSKPPSDARNPMCDICNSDTGMEAKDKAFAVKYCIQCSQNICGLCCQDHKRFKNLQNHQLIQIRTSLEDEPHVMKKAFLQYCSRYGKEDAKLHCADCKEVIDLMCSVQHGEFYNCSDIDELAEGLRKQIKCDIERMNGFVEETTAKIQQIDEIHMNFQRKVEDIEKDIIQRGTELKELVDKHTRSLLDELASIRQRVSKETKTKKEESETHKLVIQSFETYCTEMGIKGSRADIYRAANDVHLRADNIETAHLKFIEEEIPTTAVIFEKSDVEELPRKGNIVGSIRVIPCPTIRLTKELDPQFHSEICGISKLANKIYIVFQFSDSILAFGDEIPYQSEANIRINKIDNLSSIASCERSKCLYLHDLSKDCIWKIAAADHRMTRWLTRVGKTLVPLSVTSEGHVLVFNDDKASRHLEIYAPDAKVIQRFSLPSGICSPRQIIQKPNGEFVISHRMHGSSWKDARYVVSRLTCNWETVVSSINTVDISPELRDMAHMALDSDNNRIFVINSSGSLAAIDSTSLDLIKVVLKPEENRLNYPRRFIYDAEKKQLIVGLWGGKIEIYEIS